MTIYEREGKERGTQGGREEGVGGVGGVGGGVTMGREREDCLTQSANPDEIQNPKYCSFRCNMNGTETCLELSHPPGCYSVHASFATIQCKSL